MLKKLFRYPALCCLILLFHGRLSGQVQLSVTSFWASPDSIYINTTTGDTLIHYYITLKHIGDVPYVGHWDWKMRYNADTVKMWNGPTFIPSAPFMPGDSITTMLEDTILPTSKMYHGGDNIIVVWPAAEVKNEPASTVVWVNGIVGITDPNKNQRGCTISPNPSDGIVRISYGTMLNSVEHVSLRDMTGRTIIDSGDVIHDFDLTPHSKGIYFLEIRLNTGKKEVFKVLHH